MYFFLHKTLIKYPFFLFLPQCSKILLTHERVKNLPMFALNFHFGKDFYRIIIMNSFPFRFSVSSESKPGWVKNQLQNIFGPNDSNLAMKLFGSKKREFRGGARQGQTGHCSVIHPMSSFRLAIYTHFSHTLHEESEFLTTSN